MNRCDGGGGTGTEHVLLHICNNEYKEEYPRYTIYLSIYLGVIAMVDLL